MHTHVHVGICMYLAMCITYMCTYVYEYGCRYAHTYVCIYCVYVHIYTCVYVYVYTDDLMCICNI